MASSSTRTHILPLIDNWKHFLGLTKYLVDWIFIKKNSDMIPWGECSSIINTHVSFYILLSYLLEKPTLSSCHKSLRKQTIFTTIHTFSRSRINKKAFSTSGQHPMLHIFSTTKAQLLPQWFSSTNQPHFILLHSEHSCSSPSEKLVEGIPSGDDLPLCHWHGEEKVGPRGEDLWQIRVIVLVLASSLRISFWV